MSSIKLQKIGDSFGFIIDKTVLNIAGFSVTDEFEIIAERDVLFMFKRLSPRSKWHFENPSLSEEDILWLEAK